VSLVECSPATPIAIQMAGLLCESDAAELEEILRRWIAEAPTGALRRQYQAFAAQLLELKHALAEMPVVPTRRELEFQLTLMLQLAASGPSPVQR
jgi:hypothetical protein